MISMGNENNYKQFPIGIIQPVLSDCCASSPDCYESFKLLHNPLINEDKNNYNSWLSKNASAILNCDDNKN